MSDLEVTSGVLNAIAKAARRAIPQEACGMLLGRDGCIDEVLETANVAADPGRHFEIDPVDLIAAHKAERAGGKQLIGYFHSHPVGPARPSATDQAQAARDGRIWAIADASGEIGWFISSEQGLAPIQPEIVAEA